MEWQLATPNCIATVTVEVALKCTDEFPVTLVNGPNVSSKSSIVMVVAVILLEH